MKQLKSHVKHEDPEILLISHIRVLLLFSAVSLIVSPALPSSSPILLMLSSLIAKLVRYDLELDFAPQVLAAAERPMIMVGNTVLQAQDKGTLYGHVADLAHKLKTSGKMEPGWRVLNVLHRVSTLP